MEGGAYWRRAAFVFACVIILLAVICYAVGVPALLIGFASGALLVVFGIAAVVNRTNITEAAKERSPNRPLIERVRQPDPDFSNFLSMLTHVVPWSIPFFGLGIFAIQIMAEIFFGRESWVTSGLDTFLLLVLKGTLPAFVVAYLGLWSLRAYVAIKLRRNGRPH